MGATPACGWVEIGGVASLPVTVVWKAGRAWDKPAEALDSRCVVWGEYPHVDATVGVLTVPLKNY